MRDQAANGDIKAQVALGSLYNNGGEGVRANNWLEAFNWWNKAAEKGDAEAQFHLGEVCESGRGVEKDAVKAFQWFSKSAEQGYANAQLKVAEAYDQGSGTAQDKAEAAKWHAKAFDSFTKGAEVGNAEAQFALGGMYESGRGVPKDAVKAFQWYLKSAQQGNRYAELRIAEAYDQGLGVTQDKAQAVNWYSKAFSLLTRARDQGDEGAAFTLSFAAYPTSPQAWAPVALSAAFTLSFAAYLTNTAQAYQEWLFKLARQGDPVAQRDLAHAYNKGWGVPEDHTEAVNWYTRALKSYSTAAERGDKHAQFCLGLMYANGEGVATNANEAVRWLIKAGDQGAESARSQFEETVFPGGHYLPPYSPGGEMSEETKELLLNALFKWHLQSAGQGDLDALLKVAEAYDQGLGTAQDKVEAAKWYANAVNATIEAAEHGDKTSELGRLPCMLSSSKAMPEGTQELLLNWCVKSAEQGNEAAQLEIQDIWLMAMNVAHEPGHEAHKDEDRWDLKLMFNWLSKRAERGDAEAQDAVADAYQYGVGVPQDKAEAARWFIKAADQGYKSAQSGLEILFYWDVERGEENIQRENQELELLFNWFSKLAERGDAEAQRKVGYAFKKGLGVAQNMVEAIKWFVRAADQGNAEAQVEVGELYMDGEGVAKNEKEAIKWLSKAVDQENFTYSPLAKGYINIIKERRLQENASSDSAQRQKDMPSSSKAGIDVIEFSTKIIEKGISYVTWAWKITLKNDTADTKHVFATIQFVDKEGFQLAVRRA